MNTGEIDQFIEEKSILLWIDKPSITYRKMKRFFGSADIYSWKITLNRFWVRSNNDHIVKQLILHELLHLRNYWIYGNNGHDKTFRKQCEQFGVLLKKSMTTKKERDRIVAYCKDKLED